MTDPFFVPVPAVGIEITNRCSLSCRHCFNRSGAGTVQELSLADTLDVFGQMQVMGVQQVRLSGGEPTLHPSFAAIVEGAAQHGIRVSVNSNGILSRHVRQQVATLPIDLFIISLDGLQPANDSIRGQGVFDRAVETVAWLRRLERPVTLGVHLTRSAVSDVADLVALASELGANIKFAPLRLTGRARDYLSHEMPAASDMYHAVQAITRLRVVYPEITISTDYDILRCPDNTEKVAAANLSCAAGRSMLNINFDGYVYPCAFLTTPGREFAAGHIHESTLASIWQNSPAFQPFRTIQKESQCRDCFAYGRTCVGGCVAQAYCVSGRLDGHDPICFVDLLDKTP